MNYRRGISADTALRLSRYFDSTPEFWMNLQAAYDLEVTARESKRKIERDCILEKSLEVCGHPSSYRSFY